MKLTGYKNLKKISESQLRVIYAGLREIDEMPVVLKSLRSMHPPTDVIALMIHEFEVTKGLNLRGIIKTYDLIEDHERYALVQEDMHGISLTEFLQQKPIADLPLFLQLAIEMTEILSELHQQNIIHKDIKPSNFIIHPKTLALKLTDFNFSSRLQREMQDIVPPNRLEGTLVYMAPEQTGRMNMNIDYRADFYALGVTFYEMLTGKIPFSFTDPLELLHAHLANPAPDVRNINPQIPEMLSKLVQKLMAKRPIKRYQSAIGIQADLIRCQEDLQEMNTIKPFTLGQADAYDRLNISQKLYGREEEAKTLLNTYKKVTQGAVSALMVCGYSGIGKTMLINEVHRPMVADKGYFISGKFDQLQRNTPYTAITQAFNQLARQILAEPEERFEAIKNSILDVMGDVAQVMIDIAPDIELVIGPQPALESLGPQETQNRLMIFFQRFLRIIANPAHPLVIFIDDLQWIDSGSLRLFRDILTDDELSHVLLIGAYRDNEVGEQHPLRHFFNDMANKEKSLQTMTLRPLSIQHFTAMLMDSFMRDEKTIEPLAALIHKRTDGNPFFCKQVINTIYQEKLLYFDYEQKHWTWKLEAIEQLRITDNVVDLMLDKFSNLPKDTQRLMQYASCVGSRFTIDKLILISGQTPDNIGQVLWPAMQQELIATIQLGYKRVEAMRLENLAALLSKDITYQFAHDRVQQAVYQSMDLQERKQTHLTFARLLIDIEGKDCKTENLFEITDHFNQANELLKESEKHLVIDLNYRASIQARNSSAYKPMQNYLQVALNLMDSSWWENQYDLIFKVKKDYVLSLFLLNKFEEAEKLTNTMLALAKTNLDKAHLYRIQVMLYNIRSDRVNAFETIRIALDLLGVKILTEPTSAQLFFKLAVVKWRMRRFDPQNLDQQLKTLSDPAIELAFEILSESFFLLYEKSTQAFSYGTLVAMELLLVYGRARSAGIWVSAYGILNLNLFKNIDVALKYSISAEKLLKETPDKYYSATVFSWIAHLIYHFRHPVKEAVSYVEQGVSDALESGNFHMECLARAIYYFSRFVEAKSIDNPMQEAENSYKLGYLRGYNDFGNAMELHYWVFRNLRDGVNDVGEPLGTLLKNLDKTPSLPFKITGKRFMSIYYFFAESFEKCIDIHFVWFIHEEKIRYELACNETKSTNGLAFAKMIPKVQGKVKQQYLKRFSLLLRDCKWAAESCPENYLHQYLFLKGTKEQLDKNYMQALTYFNEGIVNAKKGDFYLWVAVGNELAAELFIHLSQDHAAMGYIREAHYYYDRYGMMVKVHSLEQRYPQCFDDQALLKQGDATANQTLPTITTTTSAGLDFMSVIKASQTISGEIVLDKLFERMLDIVVENAGAEYVLFLEKLHNDWVVTAKLDTRQGQQKFTMLHVILKYYKELPQTIIQYALRTNEQVVLKDAASDNQYQNDPYIIRRRPKSVLCLPILHHDKTIGAIYLENNLTTGAFTQDRITVLTTLTSQFAISLENAQHFEQIEKLYRSTERFVPKQVLKLLGKEHVEDIKLGDSIKCQISALFADIRGFTTLAESMTPERITFFLNTYMKCMAPIIREHNGFVNQFLGDGILALFPEQPSDAVDAALQMHKALEEFNEFIVSKGYPEVKMGIGINSGDAMLCTLGEEERMEANVVSDVVNSASRIEGLNKFYQTGLIVSHATFELLPNKEKYLIRVLDQVKMKGKTIGTYVYEVMPLTQDDRIKYKHEYIKAFKAAFALYEMGDFTSALEAFSDCVARQPDDGVAALLKKRCEGFIRSGPPENWDGSYTLLDK